MLRPCHWCGKDLGDRPPGTLLHLGECSDKRNRDGGRGRAYALVSAAIARGDLPRAKTLTCVDCGKPASDYDHRDYNKPLQVEPVCRSCNLRRGPAIEVAALVGRAIREGRKPPRSRDATPAAEAAQA